jgi:hypothetical protein
MRESEEKMFGGGAFDPLLPVLDGHYVCSSRVAYTKKKAKL